MPGSQELLVIALVALFVLGPERLPALARSATRGLTRIRNYGVTASKELRGVADLGGIENEVNELRRELARARADLQRALRETVASSPSSPSSSPSAPSSSGAELDRIDEADVHDIAAGSDDGSDIAAGSDDDAASESGA